MNAMQSKKWVRVYGLVLAILGYAAPSPSLAAEDEKAYAVEPKKSDRPKFDKSLRQNEDWSKFDPETAKGEGLFSRLDPLKHIDLNDDGSVWLSAGGSARARYEHYENYKFDPKYDDGFLLTRVRLHGDLRAGEHFRAFVEGKSAFSTERSLSGGQRTADTDELALQQAFVDFILPVGSQTTLTLRPGRQMLSFGKERLVSAMPWRNTLMTWDGVSLILDHGGWNTQAFWAQNVPVQKYDFNSSDRQTQFFGVYATGPLSETHGIHADAYFLGLDQSDITNTFNGTTGAERRYTVGGRLFGEVPCCGLDYDVEAAYQFGDLGAFGIQAWAFATEIGYTFDCKTKARPFIGFDYASGDNSAGGNVQTFNQLFALEHAFLGYIDTIGRQNIIDVSTGLSLEPIKKLKARAAYHVFWRASTSDAIYNSSGPLIAGGAAGDRFVGTEIDLTLKYKLKKNTYLMVGYSRFFAGDFVNNGAPTKNQDIQSVKFQVQWTF